MFIFFEKLDEIINILNMWVCVMFLKRKIIYLFLKKLFIKEFNFVINTSKVIICFVFIYDIKLMFNYKEFLWKYIRYIYWFWMKFIMSGFIILNGKWIFNNEVFDVLFRIGVDKKII